MPIQISLVFRNGVRTYTVDAPGVSIDEKYTYGANPSITTVRWHVFNTYSVGRWLGQLKGCG